MHILSLHNNLFGKVQMSFSSIVCGDRWMSARMIIVM